jgi:hypothetical protein
MVDVDLDAVGAMPSNSGRFIRVPKAYIVAEFVFTGSFAEA